MRLAAYSGCDLDERSDRHASNASQDHMRSTQGRAGVLGDGAGGRRRRAGGRSSGERGSRGASSGGEVGRRAVDAVCRSDGVRAPQGDGLGHGAGRGGRGSAETIGRRQEREQKSGCYRREMHLFVVILSIRRISTVKAVMLLLLLGWARLTLCDALEVEVMCISSY